MQAGGFVYEAAMHDSFPHAMELSEKGYNAFALIYRLGADTACEDLARAIAFLHENAEELKIDMTDYSLWGGSAGARMAAWLGAYGTEAFGEDEYPAAGAVIMQYTGLSQVTGSEPPTYACVGTRDGIASYRSMEDYISRIQENGTGAGMFLLFIFHHILNRRWIKNVGRGVVCFSGYQRAEFPGKSYSYGLWILGSCTHVSASWNPLGYFGKKGRENVPETFRGTNLGCPPGRSRNCTVRNLRVYKKRYIKLYASVHVIVFSIHPATAGQSEKIPDIFSRLHTFSSPMAA